MPLLRKEKVSLSSSGQVRHPVTSIQERRALISRQGSIWLNLEGFVMAEMTIVLSVQALNPFHSRYVPVIVVLDLPSSRSVDVLSIPTLNIIGNNSQMLGIRLVAEELLKQTANNRDHARRQNNDRDVVLEF